MPRCGQGHAVTLVTLTRSCLLSQNDKLQRVSVTKNPKITKETSRPSSLFFVFFAFFVLVMARDRRRRRACRPCRALPRRRTGPRSRRRSFRRASVLP